MLPYIRNKNLDELNYKSDRKSWNLRLETFFRNTFPSDLEETQECLTNLNNILEFI